MMRASAPFEITTSFSARIALQRAPAALERRPRASCGGRSRSVRRARAAACAIASGSVTSVRKPSSPRLTPRIGTRASRVAGDGEQRAVAAEHDDQIGLARQRAPSDAPARRPSGASASARTRMPRAAQRRDACASRVARRAGRSRFTTRPTVRMRRHHHLSPPRRRTTRPRGCSRPSAAVLDLRAHGRGSRSSSRARRAAAAPRRRARRSPSACGRAPSTSSSASATCSARAASLREMLDGGTARVADPLGPAGHAARRRSRACSRERQRRARRRASRPCCSGVKELREIVDEAEASCARTGRADDPLRRRDPPLQQGAAGRLPAARRGRHGRC